MCCLSCNDHNRITELEHVWDMLNAVVGAPCKSAPVALRYDVIPAAIYTIAEGGGEGPLPLYPAVRCGPAQRLHQCGCGNREVWAGSMMSRMRRDVMESTAKNLYTACRENHDRGAK